MDITDRAALTEAIERTKADILVNAAAFTAVDKAETEPAAAHAVNALGAENAAMACAAASIPLIHVSTDYVFDGAKNGAYVEDDSTNPISTYGRTKLEGERRVGRACARHLILRTAWLHSPWGTNFVRTMVRLAGDRSVIRVVDDQQGAPTYVPDLAAAMLTIAQQTVSDTESTPWGIYHVVNAGETTWRGFAVEVFRVARERGLPAAEVAPITTAEYPTPATRPTNSRLNCDKLRRSFGVELRDWRAGVADCVARLAEGSRNSCAR